MRYFNTPACATWKIFVVWLIRFQHKCVSFCSFYSWHEMHSHSVLLLRAGLDFIHQSLMWWCKVGVQWVWRGFFDLEHGRSCSPSSAIIAKTFSTLTSIEWLHKDFRKQLNIYLTALMSSVKESHFTDEENSMKHKKRGQ